TDLLPPSAQKLAIPAAGGKRHIDDIAVDAGFAATPGARIERILVRRGVEDLGIVLEAVLGAVAVMNVEVEHRNTADIVLARHDDADADVVQQAESHGPSMLRMVPGWSHDAKGMLRRAGDDTMD